MAFVVDLTQWRVYSAEQSLPEGQRFESIDEAQTYLWWVQSTAWWKTTFPDAPEIALELGGDSNPSTHASFAQHHDAEHSTISLHPRMMNAVVLLHEVAHCLAPRAWGDVAAIRKGKIVIEYHHRHGPYFRAAFAALAERYKIGVDPSELRRAYDHFELETPDLQALIEARAHSVEVEKTNAEMWERHNREWEESGKRAEWEAKAARSREERGEDPDPPRRIPRWPWGFWIHSGRRANRPLTSQRRLAELVSPVVKCSPRDVARLERMDDRPTDPVDLDRCLAFVAVLGVDPAWAETGLHLAPGETTITIEALEAIAPEWVSLVRHLNGLLEARPPRWQGGGDR
ncbi:MAG: hypothetical protein KJ659_12730 [Actinobacteria bacterium]|nr:hypothetical protein [Actinomycetota bacterium]MBU1609484.1 hypothetical protein [Actinomycetota bacterium]MBU2315250.1 hypothetical protein [Actinomycetota bacterium]MBU2386334.1 hypothetical protein [Actinomycetota bacterium]